MHFYDDKGYEACGFEMVSKNLKPISDITAVNMLLKEKIHAMNMYVNIRKD